METYGLISGLWTSTFALGAFIGPSIAGMLYDIVGFGSATVFVIVLSAAVVRKRRTNKRIKLRVFPIAAHGAPDFKSLLKKKKKL